MKSVFRCRLVENEIVEETHGLDNIGGYMLRGGLWEALQKANYSEEVFLLRSNGGEIELTDARGEEWKVTGASCLRAMRRSTWSRRPAQASG